MAIAFDTTLVRNDEKFLASELGDEMVMMNLENGNFIGINDIGGDIWKLTINPTNINEITAKLLQEYDVSKDTCRQDVQEFITLLVTKGILKEKGN